ncbi:MAG: RNA polymerase sigma factor [Pseudomonadota bacterium]
MDESYKSWERVYREHRLKVARVSFGIVRCPDAAQDVTQEAFLRWACKIADAPEKPDTHLGLLYRIARGLSIDLTRQVKRQRLLLERFGPQAQTVADSERILIARQDAARAAAALASVPERTRKAYLMRRYDGASFETIGTSLDVSAQRAHQLAAMAMAAIARALEDCS